jgi:hypothetical protein
MQPWATIQGSMLPEVREQIAAEDRGIAERRNAHLIAIFST